MKVKEMERRLIDAKTDEEFMSSLNSILESLCKEAKDNIERFCAKSQEDVIKQVELVNNKYLDLVSRVNDYISENPFEDKPINGGTLVDNGFKAAFVYLNPDKSYILNLADHKKKVEEMKKKIKDAKQDTYFHQITPWEDLNSVDEMKREFLLCLGSLSSLYKMMDGNIARTKITGEPLIIRCQMLEYFIAKGKKDQKMIDLFKDKNYEELLQIIERG